MKTDNVWKILIIWFSLVIMIFIISGNYGVVIFSTGFGMIFGGLAYRYRHAVRPFFKKFKMDGYSGFLALSLLVTVFEETFCYISGNRIAHPVLWIDLVMVSLLWTVWFGTWYFYLSRKYSFEEKETLIVASLTGVLYEFTGSGAMFSNPAGIIILLPLGVVVYSAIFVLPMQLIDFTGTRTGPMKYIEGVFVPFILTIPAAILVYLGFALLGVAL